MKLPPLLMKHMALSLERNREILCQQSVPQGRGTRDGIQDDLKCRSLKRAAKMKN